MQESLVAINLCTTINNHSVLLNTRSMPILFYWNGEDTLDFTIKNSEAFKSFITSISIFDNPDLFWKSYIAYFYFGDDDYTDNTIYIKDMYPIYIGHPIIRIMALQAMAYLYSKCFDKEYKYDNNSWDDINLMYSAIKGKYQDKVSEETIINGCRGWLQSTYNYIQLSDINVVIDLISERILEK